jgi:hypothetical protein
MSLEPVSKPITRVTANGLIGRGIDIGKGTDGYYQIVGVVAGVRHDRLDTDTTDVCCQERVSAEKG